MFGIKSMDCMTQHVGKLSECHWAKQALDREMLAKVFSAFTPKRGHPPSGPFSAPIPPGELGVARHDGKDLKIPGENPTWHAHTMLIWVSKLLSFNILLCYIPGTGNTQMKIQRFCFQGGFGLLRIPLLTWQSLSPLDTHTWCFLKSRTQKRLTRCGDNNGRH